MRVMQVKLQFSREIAILDDSYMYASKVGVRVVRLNNIFKGGEVGRSNV